MILKSNAPAAKTDSSNAAVANQSQEKEVPQIAQEDVDILERLLGAPAAAEVTTLHTQTVKGESNSGKQPTKITLPPILDKTQRGLVHRVCVVIRFLRS